MEQCTWHVEGVATLFNQLNELSREGEMSDKSGLVRTSAVRRLLERAELGWDLWQLRECTRVVGNADPRSALAQHLL